MLVDAYPEFDAFLIDMAVGLRSSADRLRPDDLARKELRARSSSIFPIPCRQAVYAGTEEEQKLNTAEILLAQSQWKTCLRNRQIPVVRGDGSKVENGTRNPSIKLLPEDHAGGYGFLYLHRAVGIHAEVPEQIAAFNWSGYCFDGERSSDTEYVFIRTEIPGKGKD